MTSFTEVLPQEKIAEYRAKGYDDATIQQAVDEVQGSQPTALQQSYQNAMTLKSQDPRNSASQSYFQSQNNPNLIQWQLELDSILERVEHLLRGDKPKFKNGNMTWQPAKDKKEKVLNDFGVSEIMKILSMYLNRNTILSNYDEPTINYKVYDFGMEIADLFYLKYEAMGLDDLEKRKLYPMLVRMLVDTIHSSYLRALHGGERESLREARQITQTEGLNPNGMGGMYPQERSLINPMRYISGKYKK